MITNFKIFEQLNEYDIYDDDIDDINVDDGYNNDDDDDEDVNIKIGNFVVCSIGETNDYDDNILYLTGKITKRSGDSYLIKFFEKIPRWLEIEWQFHENIKCNNRSWIDISKITKYSKNKKEIDEVINMILNVKKYNL